MAEGYKGELPFERLCELIYNGFGQWAVINFIKERQSNSVLVDVTWSNCVGCEEYSPFYNGFCLVCGGK